MKQHLPMTLLSERERELVRDFLHETYLEGGRGLWLVAKKYVIVSYWYHFLTYTGAGSENTVWNMIHMVKNMNYGYADRAIRNGISFVVAGILPWEDVDDIDPFWHRYYRGFKIKTIMDEKLTSMKQFHEELVHLLQSALEERTFLKIMNVNIPLPSIDTPF
jgi:hypothetical protein